MGVGYGVVVVHMATARSHNAGLLGWGMVGTAVILFVIMAAWIYVTALG